MDNSIRKMIHWALSSRYRRGIVGKRFKTLPKDHRKLSNFRVQSVKKERAISLRTLLYDLLSDLKNAERAWKEFPVHLILLGEKIKNPPQVLLNGCFSKIGCPRTSQNKRRTNIRDF